MFSDADKIGLWQNSRHEHFFIKMIVDSPGLYELVKMAFISGLRSECYYLPPTRPVECTNDPMTSFQLGCWTHTMIAKISTDKMAQDIHGKNRS